MHTTDEISELCQNAISKRKDETNQSDEYSKKRRNLKMNIEMKESSSPTEANVKMPEKLEEWLKIFSHWSSKDRNIALEKLVTNDGVCSVQQLRHMVSLIEPLLQRDFISLLPKELSLKVLRFLDPSDLLQAAQTCRYWNMLCEDSLMWRDKCIEEGILDQSDVQDYLDQAPSSLLSPSSSPRSISPSLFKVTYLRHKQIEYNWRYGIFSFRNQREDYFSERPGEVNGQQCGTLATMPKERNRKRPQLKDVLYLKGHDDHVVTCLQFNPTSNIIVSGSDDNTLKVWCSLSGRLLRTLTGHSGGVWSSQLSSDNIVISGSTDRTLRVWDAITGDCLHALYGHTSTVRCLALHGKHVVSGSRDATLRAWNIETGECEHVLVGHLAAVRCVQYNGNLCVSGAYDYTVRVWKVETEHCLHVLEGHSNRVYSLQFDGENIVSGSLDTTIRVWSASEGKLKHTLMGHQSLTSGMQLRKNILVSGNADSTVKVWDINTGQCLQTLSGAFKHSSAVTCLQFNTSFVITSSDDGTVKLWDLKTGEFIRNLITLPSGGSGGVVWRIRASDTTLVCAVGSRNGTEETKLLVLDFESAIGNVQEIRNVFTPSQTDESMEPSDSANNAVRWNESEQVDYGDVDLRPHPPMNHSANFSLELKHQTSRQEVQEERKAIVPMPPSIPSTSRHISASISNNSLSSLTSNTSSVGCQQHRDNSLSQSASEASLSQSQMSDVQTSRSNGLPEKSVVVQAVFDDDSRDLPQQNSMDVDR